MKKLTRLTLIFCSLLPTSVFAALGEGALTENKDATFGEFLTRIQNWLLGISGALAILFIVYGGFLYITSGGNKERIATAKQTLTWTVLGLLLVVTAGIILKILTGDLLPGLFGNGVLTL